jgi:holo-[acyl-carrier protein] synthase
MIHGIGIDMVAVSRMQDNIDKHGDRFAGKILCSQELIEYASVSNPAHYLAKRFAAKEALTKALGTGFRDGISLKNIRIRNETTGKPGIICVGRADEIMSSLGIVSCHLSLSDERDYACACVVLEKSSVHEQ